VNTPKGIIELSHALPVAVLHALRYCEFWINRRSGCTASLWGARPVDSSSLVGIQWLEVMDIENPIAEIELLERLSRIVAL
jgi:hypothetical protein